MMKDLPLKKMRIVDFTHVAAGPFSTKMLADFGAEVIKIEGFTKPDLIRRSGPFRGDQYNPNSGGMYNRWNTSKLSITIDMSRDKGVELVKKLISVSDVVINNFSSRVMKKWGLNYDGVTKFKKDIIYVSLPSHGTTGPHREYISYGSELMALAGIMHLTGFPDSAPTGPAVNYSDYVVSYMAVLSILASLRSRQETGRGRNIEISQFETMVSYMGPILMEFDANRRETKRKGNALSVNCPEGIYPCKGFDRWCAISVLNETQWASLCDVMERRDLKEAPEYCTVLRRIRKRKVLDAFIQEWTSQRSADQVVEALQSRQIPAEIVADAGDLLNDSHIKEKNYFVELPHPETSRMLYQNPAIVLSRTPGRALRAPLLGEHKDYILKEILNFGESDIAALEREGVFQ